MPTSSVALVADEVASPLPSSAAVPIDVPALEHVPPFDDTVVGLHKKNSTVPVGTGDGETASSLTKSLTDVPGVTKLLMVLDVVLIGAVWFIVVKHSEIELV